MGLEDWHVVNEPPSSSSSGPLDIIDLIPKRQSFNQQQQQQSEDPWITTALQIQSNITNMKGFLADKQHMYTSLETSDTDASLIASTVSSFTATTAREIESLHNMVTQNKNKHHYAGIVQILMADLKVSVAEPFGQLQKQRHRVAVELFQSPLVCRHATVPFMPTRPSHKLHSSFMENYTNDIPRVPRPTSLLFSLETTPISTAKAATKKDPPSDAAAQRDNDKPSFQQQTPFQNDASLPESSYTSSDVMQQETLLLQQKTHSDLEGVQKMEQMMTDITTLISQFAELLGEQQENIYDIYESTTNTKKNVDAGKDNLVDAKERMRRSNHYMAKSICALSLILLVFHWLRP